MTVDPMAPMTFQTYANIVDETIAVFNKNGLCLSDGAAIPHNFFKTLLGTTRKTHQNMYRGVSTSKSGHIKQNYVKAIYYLSLLPEPTLLEVARAHISVFESDKIS